MSCVLKRAATFERGRVLRSILHVVLALFFFSTDGSAPAYAPVVTQCCRLCRDREKPHLTLSFCQKGMAESSGRPVRPRPMVVPVHWFPWQTQFCRPKVVLVGCKLGWGHSRLARRSASSSRPRLVRRGIGRAAHPPPNGGGVAECIIAHFCHAAVARDTLEGVCLPSARCSCRSGALRAGAPSSSDRQPLSTTRGAFLSWLGIAIRTSPTL